MKVFLWSVFLILVSACSSIIPPEIRQKPDNTANVAQVREQLEDHISEHIRWGGIILNTENRQQGSWVTVISQPLTRSGKPVSSDKSSGRFIAIVDEFLEPLVFSRDRQITVTGRIVRSESLKVGDFEYEYPVIEVDHYYLWPIKVEPVIVDYPPYWRYDPWFYPDYYPRPYPYRLYPYHR